jgi:hypothetical protein
MPPRSTVNGEEWQWICVADAMGCHARRCRLTDAAQILLDQTLVARMKLLIASDGQRGGLLRIERRA